MKPKHIAWSALAAGLMLVGSGDYADALEREAMDKELRPLRAWLLESSTEVATLETCRRVGILLPGITVNKRADGIQWWQRHCVQFNVDRPKLGRKETQ